MTAQWEIKSTCDADIIFFLLFAKQISNYRPDTMAADNPSVWSAHHTEPPPQILVFLPHPQPTQFHIKSMQMVVDQSGDASRDNNDNCVLQMFFRMTCL